MASSPDESKQLQPPAGFPTVIEQKPATVSVKAASSVLSDIGDNTITRRAEYIRYSTDEEMIWQETPSLALLLPRFLKYAVLMAILSIVCSAGRSFVAHNLYVQAALEQYGIHVSAESRPAEPARKPGHKPRSAHRATAQPDDAVPADDTTAADQEAPPSPRINNLDQILFLVKLGFAGLLLLLFLAYLLKLKATKYSASSQRLIVEEGSWHSVNRPYELHQLGDAVIMKPMLLRLFGVANLVVTKPHIELYGLRNADYVRDILRQGGQLEAQRVDKIRFR